MSKATFHGVWYFFLVLLEKKKKKFKGYVIILQSGRGGLEAVPPGFNPGKLFKDLQREIRSAEKQVIALNPPKPERESKRRKKKVLADDFIDYTNLTSFNNVLEERLPDRKVKVLKVNSPQVSF